MEVSVSPFNPLKRRDNICDEEGALYMALAHLALACYSKTGHDHPTQLHLSGRTVNYCELTVTASTLSAELIEAWQLNKVPEMHTGHILLH